MGQRQPEPQGGAKCMNEHQVPEPGDVGGFSKVPTGHRLVSEGQG